MCMVFYHAMFTMGYMFELKTAQDMFWFFSFISPAFAFAFIMMCGMSSTLSRSNRKRSIPILLAALAVTAVSFFMTPDAPIVFGILHLLGVCVLGFSFLEKPLAKIPPVAGLIICLLVFFLTYNVQYGFLGFEGIFKLHLPENLYSSNTFSFVGFIKDGTYYSDYFPLLPWGFAFMAGVFTGRIAKGKYPAFMYKSRIPFFTMLGTNAFVIYVIHQPIIYGVSYILTLLSGGN